MSSSQDEPELKAGHAPAVKAGGMRVTTKHHPSHQHSQPTPEEKADEEEFVEPKPRDERKLVVSGVLTKGNADFKADAVKVAHEKPLPQHEKRPPGSVSKTSAVIHQPRKQ